MPDDPISPPMPMARFGQLEVDTFCTGCHYNLHGQPVSIDYRLGFPICRCPECGRFHPAGVGVSASSIWVRRWATLLLFSWITIVLSFTAAMLIAMGGISVASVEMYTRWQPLSVVVKPTQNHMGSRPISASGQQYGFTLQPWSGGDEEYAPALSQIFVLSSISLVLGVIAGILCVTLLWHWPWKRYFWFALIPLIPLAFLTLIYINNDQYYYIRAECVARIAIETAIQGTGLLIGVMVGRKVSRTIARTIIPPKPRQALAFLWMVDGKKLPADMLAKV